MARKYLTPIDLSKNELQNAAIQNLASAPSSPVAGQVYFDTTLHQFGYYNATTWVYSAGGGGDASTNTATSVDSEVALFSSTTGKLLKRATITGLAKLTSGVLSAAVSATDYAPATTGSSILKASSGGFANAVSGTDYAPATATSSALKGNGSGGFSAATLTDVGTPTADFSMGSHKLTNVTDPSSAQDAATKAYVDATSQGLDVKNSVVASTTGSESFTVAAGSVTQIAGTTLDGVSPAVGDRILIKDAPASTGTGSVGSTQPGNGIYTVTNATTNLTVSRATDQSGTNNPQGDFVYVEGGTAVGGGGYRVTTPSTTGAFTYGTNNIKWTQFSGAGEVVAGTGISKSGNTLSVASAYAGNGIGTVNGVAKGNGSGTISAAAAADIHTAGGMIRFTATIGDGSTTAIAVTHSLGTQDVIAQVRDASTNAVVECDIVQTSTTVTTFTFAVAPATNAYKVVIIG